ncbi:hypothetical protein MNEG_10174, partial [Monoraphidium neglectum]
MHAGEATAGSPTPGGQRSAVASPERGRGGADRQLQGSCDVMLPDVACVMAPSGQLYFNDAAWLGSEGARLVHEGLSHAAAEALGVRSMRHMHETSRHQAAADLPCPSADAALAAAAETHAARCPDPSSSNGGQHDDAAAVIGSGGAGAVYAFLCDLSELADVAGASRLEVVLDARQLAGRALLHPALGRYQGTRARAGRWWRLALSLSPALCAVLDGAVLTPKELSALVGATASAGPAGAAVPGNAAGGYLLRGGRGVGQGLAAAFGVSDVCQALAGDACCFFDPSGRVLAQSAAELRRPQPRGRRYAHRDGGDAGDAAASLLARFPSQFAAPWAFAAGHDPGATVEATLLRLPLRTPESIAPAAGGPGVGGGGGGAAAGAAAGAGRLRELGVSEADARRALAAFASQAARGLLLARGPRAVSVSVWERGEAAARAVFSCRSALAQELQQPGSGGGPGGGGGGDPAVFPGALVHAIATRPKSSGGLGPFAFLKHAKLHNQVHKHVVAIDVDETADTAALAALADGRPLGVEGGAAAGDSAATGDGAAPPTLGQECGGSGEADGEQGDSEKRSDGRQGGGVARSRESWMVSCCVEELSGLGGLARQLAGATAPGPGGESFGPLACVAARVATSGRRGVTAAGGLLAMALPLPPVQPAWGGATDTRTHVPGGNLLGAQGFVVGGDFQLEARRFAAAPGGRLGQLPLGGASRRAAPLLPPGPRGGAPDGGGAASSAAAAPPPDPRQEAFFAGVVTAWEHLLATACGREGGPAPLPGLHLLLPDLIGARTAGDDDAARVFVQMYQLAADLQAWPLHNGRLVHVREGTFLQPPSALLPPQTPPEAAARRPPPVAQPGALANGSPMSAIAAAVGSALNFALPSEQQGAPHDRLQQQQLLQPPAADLGPSGRAFVERHLPLLAVPWRVKLQLDAAGVAGLRVATPVALRPLLRRLGQQRGAAGSGQGVAFSRMGVEAAVELLEFCCGDLVVAPEPGSDGAGHNGPNAGQTPSQPPRRHPGRVRELLGLPIPTSAGTIVLPRDARAAATDAPAAAARWDAGAAGGPRPEWLRDAWRLVRHASDSAAEWGAPDGASGLSALGPLLLVPLADGRLMRASLLEAALVADGGLDDVELGGDGEDGACDGTSPVAQGRRGADEEGAAGRDEGNGAGGAGPSVSDPWAALPAPWNWLVPMLQRAGQPILDPAFHAVLAPLTGPRPRIGRPPFLGPLVRKMAAVCSAGMLDPAAWSVQDRGRLFQLLSDHPPRDLAAPEVDLLRSLPLYARLPPPAAAFNADGPSTSAEGGEAASGGGSGAVAEREELVALGDRTDWLLVPARCLDQLGGAASLLPPEAYPRLLRASPTSGELYHILGLEPASAAQLAARLLLPRLGALPAAAAASLLTFVVGEWGSMKSRDPEHHAEVAALLAATPFVTARDGTRRRPSELYDPQQQLFGDVMLPLLGLQQQQQQQQQQDSAAESVSAAAAAALFPGAPFDSAAWLPVLRECGLVHKVDLDSFLRLAGQFSQVAAAIAAAAVETTDSPPTPEERERRRPLVASSTAPPAGGGASAAAAFVDLSALPAAQEQRLVACGGALQRHLAAHHHALLGPGSAPQQRAELARLPFVPAMFGLPGHPSTRRVLACHAQAGLAADWALCWAALPLLDAARPLPTPAASALGLRSPPPLSAVVRHMQAVEAACRTEGLLTSWPSQGLASPEEAAGQLLDHLDRQGLGRDQAAAAAAAAFVPVACATCLVAPGRAFLRLPLRGGGGAVGGGAGLAPYAYELPAALAGGGRLALLKSIGLKDEPSARDLVESMSAFAQHLAGRRLNPNELAATCRVLAVLATCSDPSDVAYLRAARRASAADGAGDARPLLAPSAAGALMPARSLVAVDGGLGARLLGRVDARAVALAHPSLPRHVSRWLGVPQITNAVQESLVEEDGPAQPLDEIDGFSAAALRELLASPEFAAAAYSLIAGAAGASAGAGAGGGELREVARAGPRGVAAALRSAGQRLALVRELRTRLTLRPLGGDGDGGVGGVGTDVTLPGRERVYEFAQHGPGGALLVAQPPPGLPLSQLLAGALSRELGSPVALPLAPLIEAGAGPGGGGPAALPALVPLLLPAGHDAGYEAAAAAGVPGAPLVEGDARLLALQPLRRYAAGEL